ncbi:type 1 fimbrial protein [Erwinia endophytica]|uniref:fimbrial protein n=1 Tax=Erwinia endophytica TaxID=1563158 RepID=UPI0012660383|nr:fimbrial protein [Erwinia endophytica]KAB8312457.1 type 1 fimbrial protein [Erwinia endophytica]
MKKIILASLVPVLMASTFSSFAEDVAPKVVTVNGGKINFTGSVVAAPCAVDTSTDGQNVVLGQVATNQLAAKGKTSTSVPFSIKLVGCDLSPAATDSTATTNYTKADIKFTGSSIDSTTLALSGDGAGEDVAKNVGIEILHANKAVAIDGTADALSQDLIAGTNDISLSAVYIATADGVTAGAANSSVDFQVTYE